jgi:beta-ketoacyl-acyl-carrier-protein synthase II
MGRRVVVTGMGTVNPLGLSVDETWAKVTAGESGVGPITLFDSADLQVRVACEVKGFDPERTMDAREARRRDRFEQFASAAAQEALAQSGLAIAPAQAGRVAVIVSSAVGGLTAIQDAVLMMAEHGPRRVSPFAIPMWMSNGAAGMIAIDTGAKGPCFSVASACAAGADGIGMAASLIRSGAVDAALAGGSEATITRIGIATFDRLGALSRRNDAPHEIPAPFDADRDGLVMGEGAAVVVLEDREHALRRGATILAELAGYASTADAFHVTAPAQDGSGGAAAISAALAEAGLAPGQVDYVNAHGTGTALNDLAETRALKAALGGDAYRIPVSSTKSMTGHMMGATGALEAIFCVLAIRDGIIPPTLHLRRPDPECDLDYVPDRARRQPVRIALSNSFGFGGHNAVLAFRAVSD